MYAYCIVPLISSRKSPYILSLNYLQISNFSHKLSAILPNHDTPGPHHHLHQVFKLSGHGEGGSHHHVPAAAKYAVKF